MHAVEYEMMLVKEEADEDKKVYDTIGTTLRKKK